MPSWRKAIGRKSRDMTEYWFAYHNNEPQAVYRVVTESGMRNKGEVYNFAQKAWVQSEVIDRYIFFGEIGYEKTTEAEALTFLANGKL